MCKLPYKAIFDFKIKIGLSFYSLPNTEVTNYGTERDMEEILEIAMNR
jgi:hypothetical protein